jgi:hypothetical protein
MQGPPIPVQGQPIHDQAVHAPPAAASASPVDVGAAGHHLPPNRRQEARAPLTAAPAAVTARGGRRLRRRLRDPPSRPAATDVDATSETTTSGAFPPLVQKLWAGGILPLRPGPTSSSTAVLAAVCCQYVPQFWCAMLLCCW